jgi:2-desacetyl-2-hydroxyethyl bacteriochlorophyllide A dehydrogenase
MKAAIYHGPRDIRIEEIDRPKAGDDGLVVRVKAAGVCGSDLHAYKKAPLDRPFEFLVYGHENAGEVVEVGKNVTDIKVGERVFAEGFLPCFKCPACQKKEYVRCAKGIKLAGLTGLNGGFAEYLWVPFIMRDASGNPTNIFKLTDKMSYQDGSLIEPLAIGSAAMKAAAPVSSEVAVVLGSGVIGLGTVVNLKAAGVSKVIISDISDKRLKAAGELGADVVLNAGKEDVTKRVFQETAGAGADIIVEAAGEPSTFLQSLDFVKRGGRIVIVAFYETSVAFEPHALIKKGARIIPGRGSDWKMAFGLIDAGKMKDTQVVSHTFPLDKIKEAFETAINTRESIKVMIEP